MGARIWRTRRSMRWIWTRARCWRSRCKAPTRATRPRWMKRCAKPEWQWRSRSGAKRSCGPMIKPTGTGAGFEEAVTDKGYHSGAVVKRMKAYGVRSYIPEKKPKGRRNWAGKPAEQQAVYANRRRVRGAYGKSLLRRRGELVERSFAHCYETGAMRRCHLRGRDNILKRQLVHVGAFNLSLILRNLLGAGTPRELRNRFCRLAARIRLLFSKRNRQQQLRCRRISRSVAKRAVRSRTR